MGPEGSLQANAAQAQAAGLLPSTQLGATAAIPDTTSQALLTQLIAHNQNLTEYMLNMRDSLVRLTGHNAVDHGKEVPTDRAAPEASGFTNELNRELIRYGEINVNIEQLRTQLSGL